MTFLGLLLRLGIVYLVARLVWRAFVKPPAPRRPPQAGSTEESLGDDIVDAEWEDLEE